MHRLSKTFKSLSRWMTCMSEIGVGFVIESMNKNSCPKCGSKVTKIFSMSTGRYTCQMCNNDYKLINLNMKELSIEELKQELKNQSHISGKVYAYDVDDPNNDVIIIAAQITDEGNLYLTFKKSL